MTLRWFFSNGCPSGWQVGRVRTHHRDGTVTLARPWWRPDGEGAQHKLYRLAESDCHASIPGSESYKLKRRRKTAC